VVEVEQHRFDQNVLDATVPVPGVSAPFLLSRLIGQRSQSHIGGEVLRRGEPGNVTDLGLDDRGRDQADAWYRPDQADVLVLSVQLVQLALDVPDLRHEQFQNVQLLMQYEIVHRAHPGDVLLREVGPEIVRNLHSFLQQVS